MCKFYTLQGLNTNYTQTVFQKCINRMQILHFAEQVPPLPPAPPPNYGILRDNIPIWRREHAPATVVLLAFLPKKHSF